MKCSHASAGHFAQHAFQNYLMACMFSSKTVLCQNWLNILIIYEYIKKNIVSRMTGQLGKTFRDLVRAFQAIQTDQIPTIYAIIV